MVWSFLPQLRLSVKISNFRPNFDFYPKISIFDWNFKSWPKLQISIFGQTFNCNYEKFWFNPNPGSRPKINICLFWPNLSKGFFLSKIRVLPPIIWQGTISISYQNFFLFFFNFLKIYKLENYKRKHEL